MAPGGAGAVPHAPRVSVVVPCYQGVGLLEQCLHSLRRQEMPRRDLEVVLVLNGPDDGSEALARTFARRHPSVRIIVTTSAPAGASRARNVGLDAATAPLCTFLDHDDTLSPRYVGALLAAHEDGVVPVAHVVDVREPDGVLAAGPLSRALLAVAGTRTSIGRVPRVASFTTAKLLDTARARSVRFDESLTSGEDVEFYWRYFLAGDLQVEVLPAGSAVYRRTVRAGSVGRQPLSYAFNVVDRLGVVARMVAAAPPALDPDVAGLLTALVDGQAGHMSRWSEHHPEDRERVLALASGQVAALPPGPVRDAVRAGLSRLELPPGTDAAVDAPPLPAGQR